MTTAKELVAFVKSKVGTPYVFGAKGEIMTEERIQQLAAENPSTFTKNYIAKARKFIGKHCTDCSGLISWTTGIIRGSWNFRDTATKRVLIKKLDETMVGWAVWKPGHIGVYIGSGQVVEAKGINYGTIISRVGDTAWQEVLKLKDIEYEAIEQPELEIVKCSAEHGLIVRAEGGLNIRDYPETGSVVGSYANGAKIYPTGKVYVTPTNLWLRTSKGYVSRKYVEGWITELEGKWYVEKGDNFPHNCLREIDGKVYYFNDAGWCAQNATLTVHANADGELTV